MSDDPSQPYLSTSFPLAASLRRLADRRMIFVAGLPGTGKSLLVNQLVHIAVRVGRLVHLLQWDVARPPFEASEAGRRYPQVGGVTHAVVRKATGLWARGALVAWDARHPAPEHLLIGETPFVGNRFVELAHRLDDRAEALLTAASCRFAIAVPSREVRRFIEAERERRSATPRHPREREDAPPRVLRDLWRDLASIELPSTGDAPAPPYDPLLYQRVYERVLRHRPREVLTLDAILPTATPSVYHFDVQTRDLAPSEPEADLFVREVEGRYPDLAVLDAEIARWWQT